MIEFHKTLSDRSVHLRYFGMLSLEQRTVHQRLRRVCFIDYDREMALVVDHTNENGGREILGVGRLVKEHGTNEAEFAILISDSWQAKGLGTQLLKMLLEVAKRERVRRVVGHILPENTAMKSVSEQLGFKLHLDQATGDSLAEIDL